MQCFCSYCHIIHLFFLDNNALRGDPYLENCFYCWLKFSGITCKRVNAPLFWSRTNDSQSSKFLGVGMWVPGKMWKSLKKFWTSFVKSTFTGFFIIITQQLHTVNQKKCVQKFFSKIFYKVLRFQRFFTYRWDISKKARILKQIFPTPTPHPWITT